MSSTHQPVHADTKLITATSNISITGPGLLPQRHPCRGNAASGDRGVAPAAHPLHAPPAPGAHTQPHLTPTHPPPPPPPPRRGRALRTPARRATRAVTRRSRGPAPGAAHVGSRPSLPSPPSTHLAASQNVGGGGVSGRCDGAVEGGARGGGVARAGSRVPEAVFRRARARLGGTWPEPVTPTPPPYFAHLPCYQLSSNCPPPVLPIS